MTTQVSKWRELPIGTIASVRLGGNYRNGPTASQRPLIKMGNIARVAIDLSHLEYIPESELVDPAHRLTFGDVLFNTRNTLDLVGKVSIWRNELPIAYYNSNILRLEFKPEYCGDSRYFGYALNSFDTVKAIRALATGTTSVAAVYTRDLLKLKLSVPGKEEQCAIVAALEDADRLTAALERLIAKKQGIRQGLVQQLLSGRLRLAGFDAQWRERRLGAVGRCIRGVGYNSGEDLSPGDRPYTVRLLRSNNVQGGRIDCESLQFVHEHRVAPVQILQSGDVVVCMSNGSRALVGKAALFECKAGAPRYTFGAFMGAFRTNQAGADPRFIAELFATQSFRNWFDVILSGSSINNLRPRDVEGFTVRMPELHEQSVIADVLTDASKEIAVLRDRLEKARSIKQGMMQQLLTGRTRLPVEAAS